MERLIAHHLITNYEVGSISDKAIRASRKIPNYLKNWDINSFFARNGYEFMKDHP